jgi:cell division transport system permease protein
MLKSLTKVDYLLREAFLGLQRGGWMNWAAISTVTVLLFLFGMSLQASWQFEGLLNQFGNQLEVSVYLETGVDAIALQPIAKELPHVTKVTAVSKETAWQQLVKDMGLSDISGATQQLNGNPLVDVLRVQASSPEAVPELAKRLQTIQGVDEVQYVAEAVKRIDQLNQGFRSLSTGIIIALTLTAIAVITTTIRLIVVARRREIEVMQLVGATTAWIYLPFVFQGITFGVVGAAIAWGLILLIQHLIAQVLTQQPEFIQLLANGVELSASHTFLLPLMLLMLGSSVGLLGSLFAVRRVALH